MNLLALSTSQVLQLEDMKKEVVADGILGKFVSELQFGIGVKEGYAMIDGILCYQGRVYLASLLLSLLCYKNATTLRLEVTWHSLRQIRGLQKKSTGKE